MPATNVLAFLLTALLILVTQHVSLLIGWGLPSIRAFKPPLLHLSITLRHKLQIILASYSSSLSISASIVHLTIPPTPPPKPSHIKYFMHTHRKLHDKNVKSISSPHHIRRINEFVLYHSEMNTL